MSIYTECRDLLMSNQSVTQSKRAACFLKSRIAILLENAGNAQTPGFSCSRKSWPGMFCLTVQLYIGHRNPKSAIL